MLLRTKTLPAKPTLELRTLALRAPVCSLRVTLGDSRQTTVHIVRHKRLAVRPKIVVFEEPVTLIDWCLDNEVDNAIIGGYDLHHHHTLLGDYWVNGVRLPSEPVASPWGKTRGTMHINENGDMKIGHRSELPEIPDGDLMQVGPVLVKNGHSLMVESVSPEGFSETAFQFTPDPSVGRHPRAAIGYDHESIWTVAVDGRTAENAGLSFAELAELMIIIGAQQALNLDGGISTQLARRGRLLNNSWGMFGDHYPEGFPIKSAIIFEKR